MLDPAFGKCAKGLLGSQRRRPAALRALGRGFGKRVGPSLPGLLDQRLDGIRDDVQLIADEVEVSFGDDPLAH